MIFARRSAPPPAPAVPAEAARPSRARVGGKKTHTFVQGVSGEGKTIWLKRYILTRPRRVVIDPNATFDERFGRIVGVKDAAAILRKAGAGPVALVVRSGWDESLTSVFRHCYAAGRLCVGADEAGDYGRHPEFIKLVGKGRNNWVDVACTSLAPVALHPEIRQLYDVVIAFRQADPEYAKMMARNYFRNEAMAELLQNLPQFNYLRVTQQGHISRGKVDII